MSSLMSDAQRQAFVRRVRVAMAKASLTREALAERASCKERTLGNLLAGERVRDATVAKVARVLGIDLDALFDEAQPAVGVPSGHPSQPDRAAATYGGYLLSAYQDYIGTYVAYRRVFSDRPELFRSVYEIDWDDEMARLRFFELQRFRGVNAKSVSSSHAGGIYVSPHTGLLQLLTTYQGALRLVTLSKFRLGDDKLRGVILTQSDRDLYYQPAVAAIYLEKLQGRHKSSELEKLVGQLGPSDPQFKAAAAELSEIERSAVYFAGWRSASSG